MNRVKVIFRGRDRGGVNRTVALLLVLVAVMLVVLAVPAWKAFSYLSQRLACDQAMKSATDGLIIEYVQTMDPASIDKAMETLDQVMVARPNICPSGGEVYIVMAKNGVYKTLCGLHDKDEKQRVRLNASRAKDLLTEELRLERRALEEEPTDIDITLNGKPLTCVRVQQEEELHRGTGTTKGYEGVVAFYGVEAGSVKVEKAKAADNEKSEGVKGTEVEEAAEGDDTGEVKGAEASKAAVSEAADNGEAEAGESAQAGEAADADEPESAKGSDSVETNGSTILDGFKTGAVDPGEICYFLYADENYCAIWRANDGWTGDSYKVTD